ncbi:MAG: hypothetical protein IKI31_03875 [Treponema sp.]|nr:hypothetical protein [Treponema sp.]
MFDGAVINDTDSAIKKKDMFFKEAKNLSEQLPFKEAKLIKKLQKKLSKEKHAKSNRIKHLLVLLKPLSLVHIPTKKIIIFLESIFHFVPFVIEEYSLIVKANLIQKKNVSFFENWSLIFGRVSKRLEIFKEAFGGRFP